jgi:spore germination protein YaaH
VSILRDHAGDVPYFTYQINQQKHTVYYEDVFSLKEKISVLQSLGFGSVVFWSLGSQDPDLLPKLAMPAVPER